MEPRGGVKLDARTGLGEGKVKDSRGVKKARRQVFGTCFELLGVGLQSTASARQRCQLLYGLVELEVAERPGGPLVRETPEISR